MNDRRMSIAMFGLDGGTDGIVEISNAYHWHKGHHLLFLHEGVILIRLAEKQVDAGRNIDACSGREHTDILADQIALEVRPAAAFTRSVKGEGSLGETFDRASVEFVRPRPRH